MKDLDRHNFSFLFGFILLFFFFFIGAKKIETIPASLYVSVKYGLEKNRESYRADILNKIENYLINRRCFKKVLSEKEGRKETDLILTLIIDKLEFSHHYGASLGAMMSDQTDPEVKLKQFVRLELKCFMQLKTWPSKKILFQKDIRIEESHQKMTLMEDAEKYVWDMALDSINDEIEKKICRKYKKIKKMLSQ